ncbi:exo-beta-N-acetylmuramidase NamZ family protein [Mucilaginibacter paludis]|uniref:Uncharacterized conserved protein UCP016719 n=1 Tax=Mucilaginibacter paludis DSM 18603 TaxID=714943 RepID=H1YGF7_9SPHI|nr:DUF1343 domain-containing protein [Mucilaginibacter paludis]EHQ24509.1 Uncharacterized conserved protein UCP016719 [Mucilaginibacter paludis DSM 18603]
MKKTILCIMMLAFANLANGSGHHPAQAHSIIKPVADKATVSGADQTEKYLPYLKGKRVGMVVNPSSRIGNKASVDSLKALGINIVKIFGPEHGFRGNASNGADVGDSVDPKTGIPVLSLYGKTSKPAAKDLADIDLMIYDLQDVGARYFTYLATLHRVMEACAENNKEVLILDRPNPNGYMVDGPVLDMKLKSGIGYHPVPIAHGMTVGEYAQMINGEGWMANGVKCKLKVITVAHYKHNMPYILPIPPSPNLNTQQSVLLYPSLCLFEGTVISQGRGTYMPFTVLGNPDLKGQYSFSFTPVGIKGMSETPLWQNQVCYGLDLRNYDIQKLIKGKRINLSWLIEMYKAYPYKERFFDFKQSRQMGDFNKLAGTTDLKDQIIAGKTEEEIRRSWEPKLSEFKQMRKKYLLYP